MSGPKCSDWSVDRRWLEERARQAAWTVARELETDLRAASAAIAAENAKGLVGVSAAAPQEVARPSDAAAVADIDAYIASLRLKLRFYQGETVRLAAGARLGEIMGDLVRAEAARAAAQDLSVREAASKRLRTRKETVERVLSRMPLTASDAERATAQQKAEALLAAQSEGGANNLEMELRAVVQAASDGYRARVDAAVRAEALLAELRGLTGGAVESLNRRLEAVAQGVAAFDPSLDDAVKRAARDARADAERAYAATVLREEFEAMGYAVGEDFSTAFTAGGSLSLSNPARSPFDVEVTFSPTSQTIDTRLVRRTLGPGSELEASRQDKAAELAWCSDYSRVLSAARRRHVIARVVRQVEPGVERVPVVAAQPARSAAARQSPSAATQARPR